MSKTDRLILKHWKVLIAIFISLVQIAAAGPKTVQFKTDRVVKQDLDRQFETCRDSGSCQSVLTEYADSVLEERKELERNLPPRFLEACRRLKGADQDYSITLDCEVRKAGAWLTDGKSL